MQLHAKGSILAREIVSASASTVFQATLITEVTRVVVCNVSGANTSFNMYHCDQASNFTPGTALYFDYSLGARDTFNLGMDAGSGLQMAKGGTLGFETSANGSVTVTVYGVTQEIAT